MLSHSFDRFYIVTKFELPKTKDLRLATFKFDFECSYANILVLILIMQNF